MNTIKEKLNEIKLYLKQETLSGIKTKILDEVKHLLAKLSNN